MFEIFSALASLVQVGASAASAYQQNKSAKEQERRARESKAIQQQQLDRQRRQHMATQRVAFAKSGVKMDGTPTAIMQDSQNQFDLDAQILASNADARISYYDSAAKGAVISGVGNIADQGVSLYTRYKT